LNILFRIFLGVPDNANRNFIVCRDKVYGIDEENIGCDIKSIRYKKDIRKKLLDVVPYIMDEIERWKDVIGDNTLFNPLPDRINYFLESNDFSYIFGKF